MGRSTFRENVCGQDFSVAVSTVFRKGLLTSECANDMTKDVGLCHLTSLWQAPVLGGGACLAGS